MASFVFNNTKISGVACVVPSNEVRVEDFAPSFGDETVRKFIAMKGVERFRVSSPDQTSADLGFVAARRLLTTQQVSPTEIGALIFVTQSPDYRLPSTACVLHKRLGLRKECLAFDVNLGCSGYVYGLQIACSCLQASDIDKALLIVGDTLSKMISPEDRSSAMLFGDAGAATLVERVDGAPPISASYRTDGEGYRAIIIQGGAYRNPKASSERVRYSDGNLRSDFELLMNGADVFNFTLAEVPSLIRSYLDQGNAYDSLILHQANVYILKQISRKCGVPMSRIPISMDRYGNTSVASIPITLADAFGDINGVMPRLLLCGFGVGLSWGVVDLSVEADAILPIAESDEYFAEGGIQRD